MFRPTAISALFGVLALALLPTASAQPPGDAGHGRAYAERVCAECHETAPGVRTPAFAAAPSFSDIAATPGMTSMALAAWFVTSHPNMPNLVIPERDKEDLLAWFAAIREGQKAPAKP